jgi:hypothetical protein
VVVLQFGPSQVRKSTPSSLVHKVTSHLSPPLPSSAHTSRSDPGAEVRGVRRLAAGFWRSASGGRWPDLADKAARCIRAGVPHGEAGGGREACGSRRTASGGRGRTWPRNWRAIYRLGFLTGKQEGGVRRTVAGRGKGGGAASRPDAFAAANRLRCRQSTELLAGSVDRRSVATTAPPVDLRGRESGNRDLTRAGC